MKKHGNNIDGVFRKTAAQYAKKVAIIFQEKRITFRELDEQVEKLAGVLGKQGVGKGERVIIYLPHMPEWVVIWLALQRIGAVAVPVTHFYGHEELGYIVDDSGSRIVFCSNKNIDQVLKASSKYGITRVIFAGDGAGFVKPPGMELEIFALDDLLQAPLTPPPLVEIDGSDVAEIIYTGGTTGFPKGVPLNHALYLDTINGNRRAVESLIPRGKAVTVQGAPFNHILGQDLGLGSIMAGDTLIILPKLDLDDFLDTVDRYQATTLFGTPTFFKMVLDHGKIDDYSLQSVLYTVCAGEALPTETQKRWTKKVGRPLYSIYGATETCGLVSGVTVGEEAPPGTIGRVVPAKEVRILNPDTLERVGVNEQGELLVSSENMVTGYWNKPEETARFFITLDGRIWYRTGDIVRMDEDGWLFFVDRSVDIIKHKGYRVAATRVEGALLKHPAVAECCAVGVLDSSVGEKIKAFVVPKNDLSADELMKLCSENLASYEVPHFIEFRQELPKSPVGKLLRKILRDEERQRQA